MSSDFNSVEFNQDEFNQGGSIGGGSGTVFPTMGCVGYSSSHQYRETLRVYDDGTYRRRLRPTFDHRVIGLEFKGIKQSVKDSIISFFNARKSSSSDDRFFFYNPEETSTVDLTGAATTGRHTAIFIEETLQFVRDGRLRWSGSARFFLLD